MSENKSSDTSEATVLRLAAAMQRTALWPAAAVAVVGIVVGALLAGAKGGVGAGFGAALVLASGLLGVWVMRRTADALPMVVMAGAMFTYVGKFAVFLVVLLVFRNTTLFDVRIFAYTMLATVVMWTVGETIGFLRARVPTVTPTSGSNPS